MRSLALKGFGLDQIWAQIEHHTSTVNEKLIAQLTTLMSDEDFLRNALASTDDDAASDAQDSHHNDADDDSLDADYGDEDPADKYEFEREGAHENEGLLDLE